MKRKIAVILASDVAGYSRLIADDEEGTIGRLAKASQVFHDLVGHYDGRVFNTAGDAILAEFASAVNAVRCAIDIQHATHSLNATWPKDKAILFRMGVAIGDVVVADNGDLLGDGVNIAARLESLAEPGGVCISDNVQVLVENKVSLGFRDMGEHKLKNIPRPVRAFRITFAQDGAQAKKLERRSWWRFASDLGRGRPHGVQPSDASDRRVRGFDKISAPRAELSRGSQLSKGLLTRLGMNDGPWWLLAIACVLAIAAGLAIWPPWDKPSPPATTQHTSLPPASESASPLRAECARLAAPPGDAAGGGAGVEMGHIDSERAVPVCRSALAALPQDADVQNWTARALTKARDYEEARALFKQAAEKGNAFAMTGLGALFQNGRGVSQDYAAARRWYEMAADKGSAEAMQQLGWLYEKGRGVAQDFVKARSWYRKAAENGRTDAMHTLGWLHENGEGGAQDFAQARGWYEKAAEKGNAASQNNIGTLYESGRGVPQNYATARSWYEKAAANGSADAMNNLGTLYANGRGVVQDYALARSWLEKAAEKGNATAMGRLGALYANGNGVPQNFTVARGWFEKAAEKGNAFAMGQLGALYERGRGVAQDISMARSWYEKAAARNDAAAMTNLGVLYAKGRGVGQDYALARGWFEKAAERGNVNGMLNLGVFYANGQGVAQDFASARRWMEKAAATGHAGAMHNLGWLYQSAPGGPHDFALARGWYEKAAANGNANSMNNLGWLYENGRGVTRDFLIARSWYEKAGQRGHADAMVNLASMFDAGRGGSSPADAARYLLAGARNGSERAKSLLAGDMAGWQAATRAAVQQQLKSAGAYAGSISAKWDTASREAARKYWDSGATTKRATDDDHDCRRFVPTAAATVSVACAE
jgi:TPR repeat protein/class 3 adenylate cyclase